MKKYIIFLSLLLLLLFVNTVFPQTGTDPSNIPPGVSGIIAAHKISQSPSSPDITRRQQQWQFHNPKLGNLLNQKLNEAMSTDDRTLKTDNGLNRLKPNSPEETICVQIKCAPNPHESASGIARERVKEAIEKSNGRITGSSLNQMTIQALLPLTAVNSLTDLPEIDFILIPNRAVTFTENYTTEALDDINVNNWHDAGIYGQNTRIGVIDVGFIGYNALKGSDLPATVMVKNFVDGENDALIESNSVHGTACAEIIYDIAPDAGLYLAKIYTDIDLQEAVTWLQANNVDIISTSLGWYNLTPGDGTGGLADIVTQAYNSGMLWVTAAGNDQQRHWGGLFSDPDGNHMHNFTSDQQINFFGPGDGSAYLINPGLNYTIFARWSDWTDVDQDYDLYVYRWNGNDWGSPIASSVNSQYGISGQVPTEAVAFTTSGDPTAYGFIIYHSFEVNKEVNFEIYAPYAPRFDEILNIRSLANLADATKATTVSAIDVSSYILQDYSSMGPTNGPGGSISGGFNKPDITSYTNVSSNSYGPSGFSGTSAATPHVSATAALILSQNLAFSPAQLQAALQSQAVDIGTGGFDFATGWGRLHLDDQGIPTCNPPASISVPGSSSSGSFTISWGTSTTSSVTYILEEATNSSFTTNLRKIYPGSGTSAYISGKVNGIYFYRVKATRSQYNDSDWKAGNNGCTVSISQPGDSIVWEGHSTDWNNSANWSNNSIPNNSTETTIPASPAGGYLPLVSGSYARAKQLTLYGKLTIVSSTLTLGD